MKSASAAISLALDAWRPSQTASILVGLSLVVGMLFTDSVDEMAAYLLVALTSAVPILLWIHRGTVGIPVLSAVSSLHFLYYGVPILRKDMSLLQFEPSEILSAAFTVSLFLVATTFSWWLILAGSVRQPRNSDPQVISGTQLQRLISFGLASGIVFHVALFTDWLSGLGPAFGLVRSAMLTTATVACFMLGHARAQGLLRGGSWVRAVAGMFILVILSCANLYLFVGIFFCMAALFGYVTTGKRVPWGFLLAAIPMIIVLHAGKTSMREKYWSAGRSYGAEISVTQVPVRLVEWVETGLTTVFSGHSYTSAVDRASLLDMLLRVQRLTPDYVPRLEGRTYTVLPQMLVPRFLDPDKITSQSAMIMLNVHFGFQTLESTVSTAIGWGLIAEGYANFGRLGVIGVGLVLGFLAGFFERWSIGAPLLSLPSLLAVAVMMQLVNMEGDAAGLLTAVFQSAVTIAVLFWSLRALSGQKSLPEASR
jgi:hypothetical protein